MTKHALLELYKTSEMVLNWKMPLFVCMYLIKHSILYIYTG